MIKLVKENPNSEISFRIDHYRAWDNGHILHSYEKDTLKNAEEKARQASIEDPNDIYYVHFDDVMNPSSDYRWYRGDRYKYYDPKLDKIKSEVNNYHANEYTKRMGGKLNMNGRKLKEELAENVRDDLTHDLFNAIGDVLFNYRNYHITADEFEEIMEFVTDRLNDSDDDFFYESFSQVNESMRKKYTQRQLRKLVDQGNAEDITDYSFEEANDLYDRGYDVIGVSSGVYGINGALLKMRDTGELMAVCARNSTLMQLV